MHSPPLTSYLLLHFPVETYLTPDVAFFKMLLKTLLFYKPHPALFHLLYYPFSIHSFTRQFGALIIYKAQNRTGGHRDEQVPFLTLKERTIQLDG